MATCRRRTGRLAPRGWSGAVMVVCMQVLVLMSLQEGVTVRGRKDYAKEWPRPADMVLTYYLQQQFGVNEVMMVPAAKAAPPGAGGGLGGGMGLEVVYEFVMTQTAEASSDVMGFVRGTALVVNVTSAGTVFFVNNVIHYEYAGLNGTLSQQGEAVFTRPPWEFSILSGTGSFRLARGFNIGTFVSATPSPNGTQIVTYYEAHLYLGH